MLNFPR